MEKKIFITGGTGSFGKAFVNLTLKKLGNDFIQLTGNDDNALEFNKRGGAGAISVTANIAPNYVPIFKNIQNLKMIVNLKRQKNLMKFYNQFTMQCL